MASLAGTSGRFEPELVASLNRNKWQVWPEYAEITPHLLRAIDIAVDKVDLIAFGSKYFLHFFAIHIIASFREQQAYPLIIRMYRLPTDQLEGLLGDALYESLPRVLASVYDGNIEPIKSIIEDPSLSE